MHSNYTNFLVQLVGKFYATIILLKLEPQQET